MEEEMRGGLFTAPPLGLYRISSYLEMFGVSADIYDVAMEEVGKLEQLVKQNHYD